MIHGSIISAAGRTIAASDGHGFSRRLRQQIDFERLMRLPLFSGFWSGLCHGLAEKHILIALAAGYDTHAAFGKAFKQQFGLSPSEFRQLGCRAATQILTKG